MRYRYSLETAVKSNCEPLELEAFGQPRNTGPRLKKALPPSRFLRQNRQRASVSGEELGVRGKSLRYGAMLDLMGFVNIPLSGGQLAATAKYSMGSGGGFRFGGFRW